MAENTVTPRRHARSFAPETYDRASRRRAANQVGRWLILALLLTSSALAAQWIMVAYDDKYKLMLDLSSIRITGPIRHAWEKWIPLKGVNEFGEKFSYQLWWVAVNCSDKTVRREQIVTYLADGSVDPENKLRNTEPWEVPPPDSFDDGPLKFICSSNQ